MSSVTSGNDEPQWFVVHSLPRKERFVRDRLRELGRDAFLPLVASRRARRSAVTLAPLFPGYLFAKLSMAGGDLTRIRWMHGVRRLLGHGQRPHPVPDELVQMIRRRADAAGRVRPPARMRRGERVRIVEGPLAGLIGVLDRPETRAEDRVCVLLRLFERQTRVEIPAGNLGVAAGP